jgi:hypothetical protein
MVEKLFKWLIYQLIIFHVSYLLIWKHLINHKNVSSFPVNNQHQESQHRFFRFGQFLSTYNPNGSKVASWMKSYRLFLWFNIETKPNVLFFSLHCKNLVRKPSYHSLEEFHETMIKQQQIKFRKMNLRHLIGIILIVVLFYSEPNILSTKFYILSSSPNTNEYHYINYSYKSHLYR